MTLYDTKSGVNILLIVGKGKYFRLIKVDLSPK